jgi:Transient receptor potential (TRP) ion channel/ML-like domain
MNMCLKEPNVNVSANIQLNVYGMHPFNFTIDLCSIFHGALCPLPMYNFSGTDSIPLPSSLGVANKIPKVAYKIPDLEAFAQLTLVETSTGVLKACVQSTLSNGWSTHQSAVEWSTGGLALLALLSALWQSHSPDALAPYRFIDLLYLYQSIATTSFLNLNYPSVYRAFALNFAWAMGLFASPSMQQSINNVRHLTGGNMADASGGSAIAFVNRKFSPYNVPIASPPTLLAKNLQKLSQRFSASLPDFVTADYSSSPPADIVDLAGGDVATVTQASTNILQAGVPVYVNSMGIATPNAFMTVFFSVLIFVAICLSLLALGYITLVVISRVRDTKQERLIELKYWFPSFARAWGLRLVCPQYFHQRQGY